MTCKVEPKEMRNGIRYESRLFAFDTLKLTIDEEIINARAYLYPPIKTTAKIKPVGAQIPEMNPGGMASSKLILDRRMHTTVTNINCTQKLSFRFTLLFYPISIIFLSIFYYSKKKNKIFLMNFSYSFLGSFSNRFANS